MNNLLRYIASTTLWLASAAMAPVAVAQSAPIATNTTNATEAAAYTVNHGPYLQGLTYDAVTICFTTSDKGFSGVEVREKGSDKVRLCRTSKDGLFEADNTFNSIRVEGLRPATEYEYRIVSKQMTSFEPYKVTFGAEIATPWYDFRTFDPEAESFSFIIANDIHDDASKCDRLLSLMPLEEAEMVFYNGDIMSHYSREGQPFTSFIDVSVDRFARHKPFAVVRGNHETRGHLARQYDEYIHNTPDGKYYGVYYFGSTAVVMLDCGEDKDDAHPVYAGLVDFDRYREEQTEWLREVVRSKEFRRAKHRIAILHIPPTVERMAEVEANAKEVSGLMTWRGNAHLGELMLPVLNEAKIDVMFSAHLHRHVIFPVQKGVVEFPIIANDNKSAIDVRVDAAGIHVRIVNTEGKVTHEKTY